VNFNLSYRSTQRNMSDSKTMSAQVVTEYTGFQFLINESALTLVTDAPIPVCGPMQVLIKVLASSVNPIDWKIISGALRAVMPITFPRIIGFEACGVVVKVGSEVKDFKEGDAVWTDGGKGCYAQYVAVDSSMVGLAPTNLTPAQAAVVPLTGLTSLQALNKLEVKQDSKVLILGGSGGTGGAAIQIAKAKGCHVTTTCSGRNAAYVRSLGADEVINYREQKWWDALDTKIDAVYDCAGEKDVLPHAQSVLVDGGKFVTIAAMGAGQFAWERGITGSFLLTTMNVRADYDALKALCEQVQLTPAIHATFSLSDIWAAFRESQTGRVVGKISITVDH